MDISGSAPDDSGKRPGYSGKNHATGRNHAAAECTGAPGRDSAAKDGSLAGAGRSCGCGAGESENHFGFAAGYRSSCMALRLCAFSGGSCSQLPALQKTDAETCGACHGRPGACPDGAARAGNAYQTLRACPGMPAGSQPDDDRDAAPGAAAAAGTVRQA